MAADWKLGVCEFVKQVVFFPPRIRTKLLGLVFVRNSFTPREKNDPFKGWLSY